MHFIARRIIQAGWMVLALTWGSAWAAAATCQPTKFDHGTTRFKMAGGANAEIQAFTCSTAALFKGTGEQGSYLAYRIRWAEGGETNEFFMGDVGDPHDNILAIHAERVGEQAIAVQEESERGGRLYLWQKGATPYVLDYMGDEESSLCFMAQKDGSITIGHCHKRWYGPKLTVRWLADEGLWQAPGWKEIKAFNAAERPK